MSPVLSGSKRSLAESGVNLTLVESFKIAAASARQNSTSKPVQLPLSSGLENPGSPWLTPQMSEPRSFTAFSVWADAATEKPSAPAAPTKRKIARFMMQPLLGRYLPSLDRSVRNLWDGFGTPLYRGALTSPAGVACPLRPYASTSWWSLCYLRTIGHRGQGVDARAA